MELGLLILRFAVGATMAAHGAQKLLPADRGGMGIGAVADLVDDLGFRPARPYAWALTLAELLGGLALVLGFGTPIGAAAVIAGLLALSTRRLGALRLRGRSAAHA